MPTLDWIGKDKVINHHNDVPYKVLERKYSYDEDGEHKDDIHSENMIIHGDNLEALKSLLPQYEGKIKCSEAGQIEIPQFMIETGRSLFSEHEHQVLKKENLYAGFSLLDKDTVIDFDSIDSEIARIDIDDSDAMPKAWKLQGFDSQNK